MYIFYKLTDNSSLLLHRQYFNEVTTSCTIFTSILDFFLEQTEKFDGHFRLENSENKAHLYHEPFLCRDLTDALDDVVIDTDWGGPEDVLPPRDASSVWLFEHHTCRWIWEEETDKCESGRRKNDRHKFGWMRGTDMTWEIQTWIRNKTNLDEDEWERLTLIWSNERDRCEMRNTDRANINLDISESGQPSDTLTYS